MTKISFKGSAMLNPVPAVLVTSRNKDGKDNVFTVGWVGTACTHPPMITISIRPERLSYEYIKETREFVINLPTKSLVKEVDYCGVRSGKNIDKIKHLNLTLENADTVNAPIIKECPIALECKLKEIIPLGSHHLFLAEVSSVSVEDSLIDDKGKIHFENVNLICYSHGEYFPIPQKPIGKFGFSVQKRKKK
ncbi:flavin reductase family protein [uncultured Clostridium sp.]|uniref:flavin reductase family protein n=1 Tax=uncultured Clostridium sp. TaxID=59620 RepID=UPI0028E6A231|nr:flavin reductase family protein [uncultured Clostridium sp.]